MSAGMGLGFPSAPHEHSRAITRILQNVFLLRPDLEALVIPALDITDLVNTLIPDVGIYESGALKVVFEVEKEKNFRKGHYESVYLMAKEFDALEFYVYLYDTKKFYRAPDWKESTISDYLKIALPLLVTDPRENLTGVGNAAEMEKDD